MQNLELFPQQLDKVKNGQLFSKYEVKEIKKMLKSLGEQIKDEKIRLGFKNVLTLLGTIKEDRLLTTEEKGIISRILQATKSRFAHSARRHSEYPKCQQCNEDCKVEMVLHGVDSCRGFLKDEYGDDTRIPCRADAKCSSCDKRLCHNCWKTNNNLCSNPQCKKSRPPTPLDPLGHVSYAMPFFVLIGLYARIGNSTGIEANTIFGLVFIILMSAYLSSRK
jgi:hypothetical protein